MKAQLVREIRRFPLLIVESRTGRKYLSSITEIANAVPRFSLFQRKKFRLIRLYKQEMIKNAVPRFSLFQRKKFRLIRLYKQEMIKKKKR